MINELRELLKWKFKNSYTGWDWKVTKYQLLTMCDHNGIHLKDDRPIRKAIELLRKENMLIISNTQFKGYFLTTEKRLRSYPIERRHTNIFIAENVNRINAIRQVIDPARKTTRFIDGLQMEFKDEGKGMTY